MSGRRSQSDDPDVVALRNRADYTINCALDWIARFHQSADPAFIWRLSENIKSLSRIMQGRSASEIKDATEDLLRTQSHAFPLLGESSESSPPRIHTRWTETGRLQNTDNSCKRKDGPIFVSYSHADHDWLGKLLVHLRPLERTGRIELWHDRKIRPGEAWRRQIEQVLNSASVAILIVSANFMASDFIYANELPPLVQRAKNGGVRVFPLIVGHCLFDEDEYLSSFQTFNDPEWPLSRLEAASVDRVMVDLAKSVLAISVSA